MSRDRLQGWKGQYDRMLRWQDRARKALEGNDGNEIYDFIYAFFQSAYHLRDWLVSDDAATKEEMTNLFKKNTELLLCRDICNATKHLRYDNPSIDAQPFIAREWNPYKKEVAGVFLYSNERRPIAELMEACVQAWNVYLKNKGLKNA